MKMHHFGPTGASIADGKTVSGLESHPPFCRQLNLEPEYNMALNPIPSRQPITMPILGYHELTIISQEGAARGMMPAKLIDFTEDGIAVEIEKQLAEGSLVEIVGEFNRADGRQPLDGEAYVRRCVKAAD